MSKIHIVGKDVLKVAMPKLKKGEGWQGRKVQGGGAPVPFRSHCGNLGRANARARVQQYGVWAD